MKSLILVSILSAFTYTAFATTVDLNRGTDLLRCEFTEPYFSVVFDASSGQVAHIGEDYSSPSHKIKKTVLTTNGVFKPIVPPNQNPKDFSPTFGTSYELINHKGQVILSLTLDMKGSDGATNRTFPFTATYNNYWGGCFTRRYPAVDSVDIINGLSR